MKYNFDEVISRKNTACEKWDWVEHYFGTTDAIPLWVADMDFQSPPAVLEAIKQRAEHGVYGYTVRPESYFNAIIEWAKKRHGWDIARDWIAHSPGIITALSVIVHTFTEPGDGVIIQTPVYPNFHRVIQTQDRRIVNNPLKWSADGYTIDFEDFEAKLDPSVKVFILCSPHNPVGRVWTKEELAKLGRICHEHNVLVVADEIHGDIVYKPHTHIPFASIDPSFAENSITCMAPSKTFNVCGLNTSAVIIPNREIRQRFKKTVNTLSIGSPNPFGLVALESAYRDGENWLEELLTYLQGNAQFLLDYLNAHIPQIKTVKPEGTFLMWLDCRELQMDDRELANFMLQKAKLALNPGHTFGLGGEGFMRINIGCPRSILVQALDQLRSAVKSL